MKILDVIPIAKGVGKETLSYFSGKEVTVGSIVTIPLRKRGVSGIVVASHDIQSLKADIKDADFQLRNISKAHQGTLFLPEFIETCVLLKNYTQNTTSSVLTSMVPKLFVEEYIESVSLRNIEQIEKSELMPEKFVFQAPYEERISFYKTYIRQEFASKKSVFILCPTIADIERIEEELKKGISDRVFSFHSGLTKKSQREQYEKFLESKQPIVIIGTASYLFLPRTDISTLIVEKEGSSYYQQQTKPFIDKRDFAYVFAHRRGMKYIAADRLLRVATLYQAKEERLGEIESLSFHVSESNSPVIVSMKEPNTEETKKKQETTKKEFSIFSEQLLKTIKKAKKEKQHVLLFAGRKGLAPITACQDCGAVQRSPDSGAPLVLYVRKDKAGRKHSVYQCPITQKMYDSFHECQQCSSWKLKLLGIGVDTIVKELEKLFPSLHTTIIDGQRTKTHASTKKAVAHFFEKKGGVMVATEKVVPYITQKFDYVAIISIDNLFSVPSFLIQEKIMRLLLQLQGYSSTSLLIQTRDPKQLVLREIQKGNIIDFYRNEIRDRKQFNYPPFGLLVEVSVNATSTTLQKKKRHLAQLFEPYNAVIITQPGNRRGVMVLRAIMKVATTDWIKKTSSKSPGKVFREIFPIIESLPQSYSVKVNPERI